MSSPSLLTYTNLRSNAPLVQATAFSTNCYRNIRYNILGTINNDKIDFICVVFNKIIPTVSLPWIACTVWIRYTTNIIMFIARVHTCNRCTHLLQIYNNYYTVTKHQNCSIPVRHSCPVHPCTHVQVLGAVHTLFTPQPPVQIAKEKHYCQLNAIKM